MKRVGPWSMPHEGIRTKWVTIFGLSYYSDMDFIEAGECTDMLVNGLGKFTFADSINLDNLNTVLNAYRANKEMLEGSEGSIVFQSAVPDENTPKGIEHGQIVDYQAWLW